MRLLTVQESAARLGISATLVYQLCKEGKLPHSRFGAGTSRGTIRIAEEDLAAFAEASKVGAQKQSDPVVLKHLRLG